MMATSKQKKAIAILVESGGDMPVSKAMVQAGYTPATAKTPQKLTESDAYKALFPPDKTIQVVENVHRLALAAEDEKIQLEASKTWMDRALGKNDGATTNINFGTVINEMKDKYDD
jgi:hypothetical protein